MKFTKSRAEYMARVIREFGFEATPVFSGEKINKKEVWWVDLGEHDVLRTMQDYFDFRKIAMLPLVQEHNQKIWEILNNA